MNHIVFHNPRSSYNMASAMRTAYNFNVDAIHVVGKRYKRLCPDTVNTQKHIPVYYFATWDEYWQSRPSVGLNVAIEIVEGSKCLWDFEHPEKATYFFGPEDGSLPEEVLKRCQYKVSIPTNRCLNLAVAFGIVMNDRSMKNERRRCKTLH